LWDVFVVKNAECVGKSRNHDSLWEKIGSIAQLNAKDRARDNAVGADQDDFDMGAAQEKRSRSPKKALK